MKMIDKSKTAEGRPLRQQILRQVVAENVAEQTGETTAESPRPVAARSKPWRLRAIPLLALGLTTAFVLIWLWQVPEAKEALGITPAPPDGATLPAEPWPNPALPQPELTTTELRPIAADVFGLDIFRIVIDPGHGGSDTGTKVGALAEKDLTLDIAARLKEKLEKQGFETHLTRASDLTLTLRERSEMANLLGAHLFVSVHINYLPGGRSSRGVETYFVGSTEDPELLELARRENAHSGYDMADNNQLLKKLFTDARQRNSQAFAGRVQGYLFSSLKPNNPELVDRGVKQAPFVVLVGTVMPAILAEVACLSNAKEAELLARPLYRESIAEALARGIRRYADDVNPSQEKGS